nr:MAG TPA: hypothetical protein [Caudoviricetes sp.]
MPKRIPPFAHVIRMFWLGNHREIYILVTLYECCLALLSYLGCFRHAK